VKRCIPHIICRGLVRIRCLHELPSIIHYLSCANHINVGVFRGPISDIFPPGNFQVVLLFQFLQHFKSVTMNTIDVPININR